MRGSRWKTRVRHTPVSATHTVVQNWKNGRPSTIGAGRFTKGTATMRPRGGAPAAAVMASLRQSEAERSGPEAGAAGRGESGADILSSIS